MLLSILVYQNKRTRFGFEEIEISSYQHPHLSIQDDHNRSEYWVSLIIGGERKVRNLCSTWDLKGKDPIDKQ